MNKNKNKNMFLGGKSKQPDPYQVKWHDLKSDNKDTITQHNNHNNKSDEWSLLSHYSHFNL